MKKCARGALSLQYQYFWNEKLCTDTTRDITNLPKYCVYWRNHSFWQYKFGCDILEYMQLHPRKSQAGSQQGDENHKPLGGKFNDPTERVGELIEQGFISNIEEERMLSYRNKGLMDKKNRQYYFEVISLFLVTLLCCTLYASRAETRPVEPDDSWKVHVKANGHNPPTPTLLVTWWWNQSAPEWTYTEIIRCDDFYPDPAPAASNPVNCTTIATVNSTFQPDSYEEYEDIPPEGEKYYWYKVRVCDATLCVLSDRSSYDLNNGESLNLNGAWIGAETVTPHVPTGITVSPHNESLMKVSWTGNDPRMTDFFQFYRCTDSSMGSCEHFDTKYFNEFDYFTLLNNDYYYRVKACAQGFKNDESSIKCSALSNYGHLESSPPDAPQNLSASDGAYYHYIEITWSASEGATQYELYRDGSLITTIDGTSYLDEKESGLSPLINYNYAAKACNSVGCSGMSNNDSGYLKKLQPTIAWVLILLMGPSFGD
jgi:hypothetical protein